MKEPSPPWVETDAIVTSCRFQFARMNTLRFGLQTGGKFRIGFDYYSLTRQYSGEFQSPKAVPQGERLKIRYNPLKPQQNSHSSTASGLLTAGRSSLVALGLGGSILLSLVWLDLLRGCR